MQSTSVRFAATARLTGAHRTVRWAADGTATIAVELRDRAWLAVVADMIEGVVLANHLEGADAQQCRSVLWAAVEAADGTVWSSTAASSPSGASTSAAPRLAPVEGPGLAA